MFFDEMDSLFRTRGTGISSDIESTIVPQLLAEIDGVESAEERDRDRRVEPRGPHRPRDPAPRPPRREDQDRAARRGVREARSSRQYLTPDLPIADDETEARTAATRRRRSSAMIDAAVDAHVRDRRRRTGSSRSRTRTATRRSCTSRTSRRAP